MHNHNQPETNSNANPNLNPITLLLNSIQLYTHKSYVSREIHYETRLLRRRLLLCVWSSGFLRCGSDGMELASRLSPGPCSEYQRLQVGAENSSFRNAVRTSSAEALSDALYKSTTTASTTSGVDSMGHGARAPPLLQMAGHGGHRE